MTQRVVIQLPADVDIIGIGRMVSEISPAFEACSRQSRCEVTFDMTDLSWITPTGLATLAASILFFVRNTRVDGVLLRRPSNPNVDSYLSRMDFYDLFDLGIATQWSRRKADGRFREVVEVSSEAIGSNVIDELIEILKEQVSIPRDTIDGLRYALSELIDNVFHHAQSPVHAIVCAQTYPKKGEVELAIVDCGRGFRISLADNPILAGRFTSAMEAIQLATHRRVTGRPEHNTGEGLFFAKQWVLQNNGRMIVYSENGLLRIQDGNEIPFPRVSVWQGAILAISMNLVPTVKLRQVFDKYAPPEDDFEVLFSDDEEIWF